MIRAFPRPGPVALLSEWTVDENLVHVDGRLIAVVPDPAIRRAVLALPQILAFVQALANGAGAQDLYRVSEVAEVAELVPLQDVGESLDGPALVEAVSRVNDAITERNRVIGEFNDAIDRVNDEVRHINGHIGAIGANDAVRVYAQRVLAFAHGTGGGALLPFKG